MALAKPDNKQASEGLLSEGEWLTEALVKHYEEGYRLYQAALDAGIAREQRACSWRALLFTTHG